MHCNQKWCIATKSDALQPKVMHCNQKWCIATRSDALQLKVMHCIKNDAVSQT